MSEALVTRELVRWARERHKIGTDAVAKKLGVSVERVEAWEDGNAKPTFRQAQDLAEKLNVPFGALFLSKPPSERLPIPDLRTVTGAPLEPPSADFLDLLYDVLRKQDWYRDHLQEEGAERVPFVGRFTLDDQPSAIAADIVSTLEIDEHMRHEASNWEAFLTRFVRKAERAGVLVLRSGVVGNNNHRKLSVKEFRGFAISDDLAPLVFINSCDAKTAQIFTLAHELAHLWVGESGISNPDYTVTPGQQRNRIDRVCDVIAAETLVPIEDFNLRWQDADSIAMNLQRLGAKYRVSQFVVLRRALEAKRITAEQFRAYYDGLLGKARTGGGQEGGNFYNNLLARNSSTLTFTLLASCAEGTTSIRDAARLLNLKIGSFAEVQTRLLEGSARA